MEFLVTDIQVKWQSSKDNYEGWSQISCPESKGMEQDIDEVVSCWGHGPLATFIYLSYLLLDGIWKLVLTVEQIQ